MEYVSPDSARYLLNSIVIHLDNLGHDDKAEDIRRTRDSIVAGDISYERAAGDVVLAILLAAQRVPPSPVIPPDKLRVVE